MELEDGQVEVRADLPGFEDIPFVMEEADMDAEMSEAAIAALEADLDGAEVRSTGAVVTEFGASAGQCVSQRRAGQGTGGGGVAGCTPHRKAPVMWRRMHDTAVANALEAAGQITNMAGRALGTHRWEDGQQLQSLPSQQQQQQQQVLPPLQQLCIWRTAAEPRRWRRRTLVANALARCGGSTGGKHWWRHGSAAGTAELTTAVSWGRPLYPQTADSLTCSQTECGFKLPLCSAHPAGARGAW